jgi:hypothetical protein
VGLELGPSSFSSSVVARGGECFFLLGAGGGASTAFLGGAAAGTFKFRKEYLNAFQLCTWGAYVNACYSEPNNVIKDEFD